MVFKLINATEVRVGTVIIIEREACVVKSLDVSKTGKHGHAKVRIEAIGIFDNKKRVIVVPGHERFEVPMINKLKGQVLSVQEEKASIMDLESFETLDVGIDKEIKGEIKEGDNVEYWDVDGIKIIKRKI
jgi:translation initiation factor 5A